MWVYGRRSVEEVLRSSLQLGKLMFVQADGEDVERIVQAAKRRGVSLQTADRRELDRIAPGNHQGVALQVLGLPIWELKDFLYHQRQQGQNKNSFICLLDEIQDPQNLGSIIRSAVCFGADAVILPKWRSATITESVMRASSGAVAHIPIIEIANLSVAIERLKENGYFIYGADVDAGKSLATTQFTFPVGLVLGNEHRGIKPMLKKACDELITIPQMENFDSLNVSSASTLFLYEISKQRR